MAKPKKLSPDPHGQAAFMLCDALMIVLIEKGFLSKEEAVGIIDVITDVKKEFSGEIESSEIASESIQILRRLSSSLKAVSRPLFSLENCDGLGSCLSSALIERRTVNRDRL